MNSKREKKYETNNILSIFLKKKKPQQLLIQNDIVWRDVVHFNNYLKPRRTLVFLSFIVGQCVFQDVIKGRIPGLGVGQNNYISWQIKYSVVIGVPCVPIPAPQNKSIFTQLLKCYEDGGFAWA